jgi:pimeloyl-ACP methyl ester carboxylesterase
VHSFLTKLKVDQPYCLIGHSFGGRVILKALGQGYLKPERIVLLGSAGVRPTASSRQLVFRAVAKVGKQATRLPGLQRLQAKLRRSLYESSGSTDYLEAGQMRQIFLNVIGEDLQTEAAKIKQPSLLIWGEHDEATPVTTASYHW